MRKTLGYVNPALVPGGKLNRDVSQIGRRLRPQIYDNIENGAADTTHIFRLRHRRQLEVHASDGPTPSVRTNIRLRHWRFQPTSGKLVLAKQPREKAPFVLLPRQINDECACQAGFGEN